MVTYLMQHSTAYKGVCMFILACFWIHTAITCIFDSFSKKMNPHCLMWRTQM
jgi:hypothetical protein